MTRLSLWRRGLAELLGTGLLVTVVVGSGIAAQRLSVDTGLQLLENSIATALGLGVLIVLLAPASGAHFNPVVSTVDSVVGRRSGSGLPARELAVYLPAQLIGGVLGAVLANAMFAAPTTISTTERATPPTFLAEIVATAGLVLVIMGLSRSGRSAPVIATAVGAYIGAAYWFTSSTSFANPAVTVGRMFTDTFAGIAPTSVLPFLAAQLLGAAAGAGAAVWLFPAPARQLSRNHRDTRWRSVANMNGQHSDEPHRAGLAQRLNWLRAGVLGANDGIVSTAAVVVGVAGATAATAPVLIAGSAALVGGAISMALGEYVSVSSQRDSEHALIEKETAELGADPEQEFLELVGLYEAQGLSTQTATQVARELTEHDVLRAHLSAELNIDPDDVVSPWYAALASAISFTIGALLPMATILLVPHPARIAATFVAVLVALAVTGWAAAWIGGARPLRATLRTVIGGALALAATYAVGVLFGTTVG